MRNSSGLPLGKATFKHVPLGAGGQIIQFSQDTTGATKVICADIHGAYVKGASDSIWRQLFLASAIPNACVTPDHTWTNNDHSGCADAVVAPSSASTIYMIYDGYLLKSTDTGASFAQTGATRLQFLSNGYNAKNWGHALTVDPNNASVILYGTQGHSVFYSINGGTNFTDLSVTAGANTPGDSVAGVHLTACDPTSTQSGGVRQRWFYTKYGTGVYTSSTGPGGTWSLMNTTGMPTNPTSLYCDAFGTLWVTQYGVVNNVWKWTSGGGWVNLSIDSGTQFSHLAVDPANASKIIAVSGATYFFTANGGTSWGRWNGDLSSNPAQIVLRENSIKYLDVPPTKQFHPVANQLHWDRATAGRLIAPHGCGIAYCDVPTSGSGSTAPLVFHGFGEGIEELVSHTFCAIPGGKRLAGCWDMGCFDIQDLSRPVNLQKMAAASGDTWAGQNIQPVIQQPCSSIDYAADNPNWVAFMQHGGWYSTPITNPHMGYSSDGGATLQPFPTTVPNKPYCSGGGSLAVGNAGNVIVIWNTNARAVYTKDGGSTWADVPIPGIPANGTESGWEWQGNGYFLNKFVIAYDKAGGYFYAFNYGPPSNTSLKGIWRSTNGDSWTQQCTSAPTTNYVGSVHLRSVPGQAGHLFFTAGTGQSDSLVRSTNGGATWAAVTTNSGQAVNYVTDVGFGKAASGKTYPSIYYWGAVNGVYGLYRSDDNMVTSILLSSAPAGSLDYPMVVAGDPDVYGRVWLCMSGNGVIVGDYNFPLTLTA